MSKSIEPQTIIDTVCKVMNIQDIKIQSRKPVYAHARFIVIKLMLKHTMLYYPEIGELLERDTTTIYSGEVRCEYLIKNHTNFQCSFNAVKEVLEELCA